MANLVTNHDPYHIHKILGLSSLLNYLLRIYYLLIYGTAFPEHEPIFQAVSCVLLHGILSASSLLLPLPSKRNFSSPMIWPEFRLHSITFAMRHVIATTLTISSSWPTHKGAEALMKLVLVVTTIQCASWITERFGDHEKRTTNSMPYPTWITEDRQKGVKDMYTRSQFGATKAIFLGDPTLSFFPLFGIQMAPLLMTLVRKGKITCITYHKIYAFSLLMSYVALFVRLMAHPEKLMIVSLVFASLFPLTSLRKNGFSPEIIWILYAIFHFKLAPIMLEYFGMSSVVLVSAVTVLVSGIYTSGVALKSRIIWILLAVIGLIVKQLYFTTDLTFETRNIDPIILKIVPMTVIPVILEHVQAYRCLYFDRKKETNFNKIESNAQNSNETIETNNNSEQRHSVSKDCKFLNS